VVPRLSLDSFVYDPKEDIQPLLLAVLYYGALDIEQQT
jgi:hypothetical protein